MLSSVGGVLIPHRVVAGISCIIGENEFEIPYEDVESSDSTSSAVDIVPVARWAPGLSEDTYDIDGKGHTRAQALQNRHHEITGEPKRRIDKLKQTMKLSPGCLEHLIAAREAMERGQFPPGGVVYGGISGENHGFGVPSGAMPVSRTPKLRVRNLVSISENGGTKQQKVKPSGSQAGAHHRRSRSEEWDHIVKCYQAEKKAMSKLFAPAIAVLRAKQVADGQDPKELWLGQPIWAGTEESKSVVDTCESKDEGDDRE